MSELETARLRLRPFVPDDASDLARIYSNPHVTRYLPGGPFAPEQGAAIAARVVERFIAYWGEHGFGVWAVIDKATGCLIGQCGFNTLPDSAEIELLYLLDEPYWNRGLATEAARASVQYGFDVAGLDRIVAIVLPENMGSRRVMEKAGLAYEKDARFFDLDVMYYAIAKGVYQT